MKRQIVDASRVSRQSNCVLPAARESEKNEYKADAIILSNSEDQEGEKVSKKRSKEGSEI